MLFARCPVQDQLMGRSMRPTEAKNEHRQTCWGSILSNGHTRCTEGFEPNSGHFKNKLCPTCRNEGIAVEPDRVRVLLPESEAPAGHHYNPCSHGCFSEKDAIFYRILNQTIKCKGNPIVLLRDASLIPSHLSTFPMPPEYIDPVTRRIHFICSGGTLIPSSHMGMRRESVWTKPIAPAPAIALPDFSLPSLGAQGAAGLGFAAGEPFAVAMPLDDSNAHSGLVDFSRPVNARNGHQSRPNSGEIPELVVITEPMAVAPLGAAAGSTRAEVTTPPAFDDGTNDTTVATVSVITERAERAGRFLELALLHAQAATLIQQALDHAEGNATLGAYHAALSKCISPLGQASEALRVATCAFDTTSSTASEDAGAPAEMSSGDNKRRRATSSPANLGELEATTGETISKMAKSSPRASIPHSPAELALVRAPDPIIYGTYAPAVGVAPAPFWAHSMRAMTEPELSHEYMSVPRSPSPADLDFLML